jgi:hypothetical protein
MIATTERNTMHENFLDAIFAIVPILFKSVLVQREQKKNKGQKNNIS